MIKYFLEVADFIFPPKDIDSDALTRARILVFLILCSAVFICLIALATFLLNVVAISQIQVALSVVAAQMLFLLAIRITRAYEWIGVIYLAFTTFTIVHESIFVARSFFFTGMHIYPLVILFGFLISRDAIKRGILCGLVLLFSILPYVLLRELPITIPYGLEANAVYQQLALNTFGRALLTCFCLLWYLKVKLASKQKLEEELLWQLKAARIDEISTLIKSMFPELHTPLLIVGNEAKSALSQHHLSGEGLSVMEVQLKSMKKFSQSIIWIYKAYRNEFVEATSAQTFREQLEILLARKFEKTKWTTVYSGHEDSPELAGPLPTLALLIVTLAEVLITLRPLEDESVLHIRIAVEDEKVIWHLSVPRDSSSPRASFAIENADSSDEVEVRNNLIAELIKNCEATVKEETSGEGDSDSICIQGHWLAMGKQKRGLRKQ